MTKNIVEKAALEKPLLVYNRTKKRSEDLVIKLGASKVEALDSVEDGVRRADIIFTCLSNDAAVQQTYSSIVKSEHVKGRTFIECSTIHPDTTEIVAKLVTDAGAEFVSSPGRSTPILH